MSIHKVGGIHFWRIGRLGGSFYRSNTPESVYATGYRVIAAAFAAMLAIWIAIGFNSGFIN